MAIATFRNPNNVAHSALATVRQPLDGGSSIVEAWNEALARVGTSRTIGWQTLEVEQLASNRAGRLVVGGRTAPGTGQAFAVLEVDPLNGFSDASPGLLTVEEVTGGTRLARVRLTPSIPQPIVLTESPPTHSARVFRMAGNEPAGLTLNSTGSNPTFRGRDLIELPGNVLAVATRCGGAGSFCNSGMLQGMTTTVVGWWTNIPFSPMASGLGMPNQLIPFNQVGSNGPLRFGTDNQALYVAGEDANGLLVVERWQLMPSIRLDSRSSTAPMTPIDVVPSPTGSGVLVLARTRVQNSFGGVTLNASTGSQANVVLIHVTPTTTRAVTWDLPGDQDPVGFDTAFVAGGVRANDPVIIIGNQGPDGFIWRVPQP